MSEKKSILKGIRSRIYTNGYLIAAFFIPVILMIFAYISFDIYPFGARSVLSLDLNAQYVYYYDYIHDVLGNGESLFYSWSRNLSGEFMGIIGYYLASPVNILVWLFPREMITEGLLTMMLAKFGICGVTTALYLHKGRGISKTTAAVFAPMYAMCAYMVVQTMDPMWLDGVFVLPLVCWGVESLIREYRFRLLIGSLIYAFVSNFYIGFMIAVFTALYFLACFFGMEKYDSVKNTIAGFIKKGLLTALSGVTAALCSCFMLLPVYYSLQNGKFEFTTPDYTPMANFELLSVARKLFPNSYDTVRMDGLPFIYCGSMALILAGVYFFARRIRLQERISTGIMLGVLVVCMYIRPVDMMWHGGQMPNWLPYRYSFMISLILVTAAAQAFEQLRERKIPLKSLGISTLFFTGLVIYIESTDTVNPTLGNGGKELFDGITVALPAIAFLIIAGLALVIFARKKTAGFTRMSAIFLTAVVAAEISFNTANTLEKMHGDIVFSTRDSYLSVILPLREKVRQIKAEDDGFYRIEKNFFRTVNDPIAVNMYGLSHSSSTLNAKAINMLGYYGFTSNGHYSRFSGNTPLTSDIFGVKYIMSTVNNYTSDIRSADDISVYKNEDALPIVYLTDMAVKYENPIEHDKSGVFENQNRLLSAMTGGQYLEFFEPISYATGPVAEDCVKGNYAGGHVGFTSPGANANITYTLFAPRDGEIYLFIPTDYQREVTLYVNEKSLGTYFESDNHHIVSLGSFEEGEVISVKLKMLKSDLYFQEPLFAMYNPDKEIQAVEYLHSLNADTTVEKLSSTHLKVTAKSDNEQMLFTTIPKEKGWTVYVNGAPANITGLINDSLMGVELSPGENVIEFKFFPAGLKTGLILTVIGICIFVGMILIVMYFKRPIKLKVKTANKASESGEPEETPAGGEPADIPESGEPADTPESGEPVDTLASGEPADTLAGGEPEEIPADGEPADTPESGEPEETPASGEPEETPAGGEPEETPSDGKKNTE